jgi:CO/xanthine dehydrogenase FAD-binding subunit
MSRDAHPELPEFDYIRPANLVEASQFLAQHAGESRPMLGGTDIFVRMRDGLWHDHYLVDIKKLDGTDEITYDHAAGLTIGAAVNMNRVMQMEACHHYYPVLEQACRSVASYQLRTRATIVGNICNASPAGDTIGASMLYDGLLTVHGVNGFRQVPLVGFFIGPGKTKLLPGDIVTKIVFPRPAIDCTGVYLKLGRNTWSDLSIVGVTALGCFDPATVSGFRMRLSLASVAPVPLEVTDVQKYLADNPLSAATIKQAAAIAQAACSPIDDVRGSARYRSLMVASLTQKALTLTWKKLQERQ